MADLPPRIVLKSEAATLVYHAQYKIVHHTIHQPVCGPAFRDVLTRGAEILESRHANKWLSDNRCHAALRPEDGKWALEVWSKRAIAAGWKYWAIIMPDAALGRANMRRFIREYADRGVTVQVFGGTEDALAWLKNPSVPIAI